MALVMDLNIHGAASLESGDGGDQRLQEPQAGLAAAPGAAHLPWPGSLGSGVHPEDGAYCPAWTS